MRVKMSKQPPPAPTASAVSPCPTVNQIVGRPRTGSLPSTIAPPDHPPISQGSPGVSTHLFSLDFVVDGWLCGPGTVNRLVVSASESFALSSFLLYRSDTDRLLICLYSQSFQCWRRRLNGLIVQQSSCTSKFSVHL